MGFIAEIAKRSVFAHLPVFILALLTAALGATQPFNVAGNDLVLLAFAVFLVPVLLAIVLKSFRKAMIATTPLIFAALWTIGTAKLIGVDVGGAAALFVAVVLGFGATDNLIVVRDYFRARGEPKTVASSIVDAFEKNEKELLGGSIIAIITFLSLSMASSPVIGQLGVVSAVSVAYALIANVVVLPALMNLYEFASARRAITGKESTVLSYAKSYGKSKESHPFYASWLGVAIEEVEEMVENLEAKGFLGPYFFTLEDPLVWFLLLFSFVLGGSFDNFAIPPLSSMIEPFLSLATLTVGLCVQGPQLRKRLNRKAKKLLGLLLMAAGGYIAYLQSFAFLEGYLLLTVVGLLSVYLAGTKFYILSNLASSVYYGIVFSVSWSNFGVLELTDNIYAAAVALLVFVTMLGIEEETYVKLETL